MARKFFHVCAGMLMLALFYHFGAATSTAQGSGAIECAGIGNGEAATLVIGRQVYFIERGDAL